MFDNSTLFKKKPKKLVAIVVPLSNRTEFTPEEEISLRHLIHYLGGYDKYFGSAEAHNKLILSGKFYKAFNDYKYILIYHLDSLVFSDQLTQWCNMDFDFIGAPWIKHKDAPYAGNLAYEGKVGNSGFALKKVESFLKVLCSPIYSENPTMYWERTYAKKKKYIQYINFPKRLLKYLTVFNGVKWEIYILKKYTKKYIDDRFWANRATHYYPEFKIAPVETALRFAFECVPRYCFELNNHTLPFGCHAWHRYDREFWEPYLLK